MNRAAQQDQNTASVIQLEKNLGELNDFTVAYLLNIEQRLVLGGM